MLLGLASGGCMTTSPGLTPTTAGDGQGGFPGNVTYQGLTLGLEDQPTSHGLGVTFAPPNVILSAQAPSGRRDAIDYLVARQDSLELFHVIGDQVNGTYRVEVPILRFRAGDYTIKAFVPDDLTPFGQAALHVSGKYP